MMSEIQNKGRGCCFPLLGGGLVRRWEAPAGAAACGRLGRSWLELRGPCEDQTRPSSSAPPSHCPLPCPPPSVCQGCGHHSRRARPQGGCQHFFILRFLLCAADLPPVHICRRRPRQSQRAQSCSLTHLPARPLVRLPPTTRRSGAASSCAASRTAQTWTQATQSTGPAATAAAASRSAGGPRGQGGDGRAAWFPLPRRLHLTAAGCHGACL